MEKGSLPTIQQWCLDSSDTQSVVDWSQGLSEELKGAMALKVGRRAFERLEQRIEKTRSNNDTVCDHRPDLDSAIGEHPRHILWVCVNK
jgi:hypothetical protein